MTKPTTVCGVVFRGLCAILLLLAAGPFIAIGFLSAGIFRALVIGTSLFPTFVGWVIEAGDEVNL